MDRDAFGDLRAGEHATIGTVQRTVRTRLPCPVGKHPAVGKAGERELRLLLAVKLFELKRVSTGQAADIAGLSRFAFLDELAKMGVAAIDFEPSEAEHEFGDAR